MRPPLFWLLPTFPFSVWALRYRHSDPPSKRLSGHCYILDLKCSFQHLWHGPSLSFFRSQPKYYFFGMILPISLHQYHSHLIILPFNFLLSLFFFATAYLFVVYHLSPRLCITAQHPQCWAQRESVGSHTIEPTLSSNTYFLWKLSKILIISRPSFPHRENENYHA